MEAQCDIGSELNRFVRLKILFIDLRKRSPTLCIEERRLVMHIKWRSIVSSMAVHITHMNSSGLPVRLMKVVRVTGLLICSLNLCSLSSFVRLAGSSSSSRSCLKGPPGTSPAERAAFLEAGPLAGPLPGLPIRHEALLLRPSVSEVRCGDAAALREGILCVARHASVSWAQDRPKGPRESEAKASASRGPG